MSELIQCPSCRRQVNLPTELIGKTVQCPECGVNFIAVARQANVLTEAPQPGLAPLAPERDFQDFARAQVFARLRVPAFLLLLVGFLGLLASGASVWALTAGASFVRDAINDSPAMPEAQKKEMLDSLEDPNVLTLNKLFLVVNLVIMVGAALMLQARAYPLAMAVSFAALLNFNNLCCLFGLPVGIWCLIVLNQVEVRALFFETVEQPEQ